MYETLVGFGLIKWHMLQYKVFIELHKTTTYFGSVGIQEHINHCVAIASKLHDLSDKTVGTARNVIA